MACCASTCAADEYFGEAIATRDLQRYRQKGPDRVTRLLLDRLRACNPFGDSLIDVSGGVGVVTFELLTLAFVRRRSLMARWHRWTPHGLRPNGVL